MGLDVVVWRGCSEQERLGEAGFMNAVKLKTIIANARRLLTDNGVAKKRQPGHAVEFQILGEHGGRPVRRAALKDLEKEYKKTEARLSECERCPLGKRGKGGCFAQVPFVQDDHLCSVLFEWFEHSVEQEGSAARALFDGVLTRIALDDMESFVTPFTAGFGERAKTIDGVAVTDRALLGALLRCGEGVPLASALPIVSTALGDFLVYVTIGRGVRELAELPVEQLVERVKGDALQIHAPLDTWDLVTGPMSGPLLQLAALLQEMTPDDGVIWD